MKEEKIPFVAYLARGKTQENKILNFIREKIPNGSFNHFNCLYRWGRKNEGFTDDKYRNLDIKEVRNNLLYKLQNSSNAIIIRGELGNLEDELQIGLLSADYIARENKIFTNYYWMKYTGKFIGQCEEADREKIFPRIFEQNDYSQGKLLKLIKKLTQIK